MPSIVQQGLRLSAIPPPTVMQYNEGGKRAYLAASSITETKVSPDSDPNYYWAILGQNIVKFDYQQNIIEADSFSLNITPNLIEVSEDFVIIGTTTGIVSVRKSNKTVHFSKNFPNSSVRRFHICPDGSILIPGLGGGALTCIDVDGNFKYSKIYKRGTINFTPGSSTFSAYNKTLNRIYVNGAESGTSYLYHIDAATGNLLIRNRSDLVSSGPVSTMNSNSIALDHHTGDIYILCGYSQGTNTGFGALVCLDSNGYWKREYIAQQYQANTFPTMYPGKDHLVIFTQANNTNPYRHVVIVVDKVNGGILQSHQMNSQYTYSASSYPYGAFLNSNEDSFVIGLTTQNYAKTSGVTTGFNAGYQGIVVQDSIPLDNATIGSSITFGAPTSAPGGAGGFVLGDNNSARLNSARTDATPITTTDAGSALSSGAAITVNPLSPLLLWGNV